MCLFIVQSCMILSTYPRGQFSSKESRVTSLFLHLLRVPPDIFPSHDVIFFSFLAVQIRNLFFSSFLCCPWPEFLSTVAPSPSTKTNNFQDGKLQGTRTDFVPRPASIYEQKNFENLHKGQEIFLRRRLLSASWQLIPPHRENMSGRHRITHPEKKIMMTKIG